jgi:hypothetical protein
MQPARRLTHAVVAAALCLSSFAPLPRRSVVAAACPVEPPSPLRVLYLQSERVVAARVGESASVEGADSENLRKTAFEVTESLKGDGGEKSLYVYHYVWADSPDLPTNFRRGDTLLLFLSRGVDAQEDGYYVTDARYGAKKLAEADLKVYLKRIEELQWIMRVGKPDPDELAEWLVRCAEEPATRWEGAYELAVSASLAAQAEEEKKGEAEEAEATEAEDKELDAELGLQADDASAADVGDAEGASAGASEEAEETGEEVSSESENEVAAETETETFISNVGEGAQAWSSGFLGSDVNAGLIKRLNEEQKARLASALFDAEKLGEGEMELVEVVSAWEDARLAPFLVNQLRKLVDDPPYEAERLASALGVALKDKRVARLAQKYSENAPYYDETPEGEGEAAEDGATATQEAAADTARPKHTQRRSEMLKKFIAAVERRMNAGAESAQM